LNGANILFFLVVIFALYPIASLFSVIASPFLTSILCDEKNLSACPPDVVSGFQNMIHIFILI